MAVFELCFDALFRVDLDDSLALVCLFFMIL